MMMVCLPLDSLFLDSNLKHLATAFLIQIDSSQHNYAISTWHIDQTIDQ